jgi:hypothetical protein
MERIKNMKKVFYVSVIVLINLFIAVMLLQGQIIYNNVGHIPQSCQVDWTNAGLIPGTSFDAVDVYVVTNYGAVPSDGQNDYSAVMAAINAAQAVAGLSVVYFPAGTYNINNTINLSRTSSSMGYSDIVLQGAGSNRTILQFSVGSTNNCIKVYGVESGDEYGLTNIVTKGSTLLERSDLSMFNVNDWIHLCERNFPYGGSEFRFVGQITQLSAINYGAGIAIMKDEASKEYRPQYTLWIQKLYPIMNVGIENLKIQRMDQNWSESGANINFSIAVNCWVRGVESDNTTHTHLANARCSHLEISGNYIHHARSYGEYEPPWGVIGTGYGMTIGTSSNNCLIVNNIWHHMRHAMTVGLGANCNVFAYNYSREQTSYEPQMLGDICLHGRYPYANLFEQNIVCQISADDTHDKNGPYNAFLRNWVVVPPMSRLKLHGPIWLHDAPNTGVLGCETWMGPGGNPIDCAGSTTSLSVDIYGRFDGAFRSHAYMANYESTIRLYGSALADVSYYYSLRPDYLDDSYTWPSLGPNYTTSCSQSIPAYSRYWASMKTYLENPTLKPVTTSGTLPYDQTWPDGHTLTGNIIVPDRMILTIEDDATINLNGYHITFTGGTLDEGSNITWQPVNIKIYEGSTLKGQYPSIQSAFTDATSGQTVSLAADTYSESNNLTVSTGVTLQLSAGTTFKMASGKKLTINGTLKAEGTYSNRITFQSISGTWYGIKFYNGSSSSRIKYCTIKNATTGIYMYNTDVYLHDNKIQYNDTGMLFENYSDGSSIVNCHEITYNDSAGIRCKTYSDPLVFTCNEIRDNGYGLAGVYGDNSSVFDLGRYSDQGHNSIYWNDPYEVYSTYSGTIYACYNWWGDSDPDPNVSSNVSWLYYLTSDPNSKAAPMADPTISDPPAINKVVQSDSDTTGISEVDKAYLIYRDGDYQTAIARSEAVTKSFAETEYSKYALFDLGSIYWYYLNDRKTGEAYYRQLIAAYPGDDLAISALATLGEWDPDDPKGPESQRHETKMCSVPEKFSLEQITPIRSIPRRRSAINWRKTHM